MPERDRRGPPRAAPPARRPRRRGTVRCASAAIGGRRAAGGDVEPDLVGAPGARNLRVDGRLRGSRCRRSPRPRSCRGSGRRPPRRAPGPGRRRSRAGAFRPRRPRARASRGVTSTAGGAASVACRSAHARVALLRDAVARGRRRPRTRRATTPPSPTHASAGRPVEPEPSGERPPGVGSAVDEPRRHELERDERAAAETRRQRAVDPGRRARPQRPELEG